MIRGYNHEIPLAGNPLHVQTELYPNSTGFYIESHVYSHGAIVTSTKSKWPQQTTPNRLEAAVRGQHRQVIRDLLSRGPRNSASAAANDTHAGCENDLAPAREVAEETEVSLASARPAVAEESELRHKMNRFVRAVGQEPPDSGSAMLRRLRSIVTAIAVLIGHIDDRELLVAELGTLKKARDRTLGFLAEPRGSRSGLRLWHGFAAVARRFATVNDRQSLLRHDHEFLTRVCQLLDQAEDADALLDHESVAMLKLCRGRDGALDDLLEDPLSLRIGPLRQEVARVAAAVGQRLDHVAPKAGSSLHTRRPRRAAAVTARLVAGELGSTSTH